MKPIIIMYWDFVLASVVMLVWLLAPQKMLWHIYIFIIVAEDIDIDNRSVLCRRWWCPRMVGDMHMSVYYMFVFSNHNDCVSVVMIIGAVWSIRFGESVTCTDVSGDVDVCAEAYYSSELLGELMCVKHLSVVVCQLSETSLVGVP